MKVTCKYIKENIDLYLCGAMDEHVMQAVQEHLAYCESCRELVQQHKKCIELLGSMQMAQEPPYLQARIQNQIRQQKRTSRYRRIILWPGIVLAAALTGLFFIQGNLPRLSNNQFNTSAESRQIVQGMHDAKAPSVLQKVSEEAGGAMDEGNEMPAEDMEDIAHLMKDPQETQETLLEDDENQMVGFAMLNTAPYTAEADYTLWVRTEDAAQLKALINEYCVYYEEGQEDPYALRIETIKVQELIEKITERFELVDMQSTVERTEDQQMAYMLIFLTDGEE